MVQGLDKWMAHEGVSFYAGFINHYVASLLSDKLHDVGNACFSEVVGIDFHDQTIDSYRFGIRLHDVPRL